VATPRLVEKLTSVPSATRLPNWSVTVAVSALRLPTWSVLGAATSARLAGAPGVKVTSAVALRLPSVAVTTAVPGSVELSMTVAMPPSVVALLLLSAPKLVEKLTSVPSATGLPNWSVTMAVSVLRIVDWQRACAWRPAPGWPARQGVNVTCAVALTSPAVAVTVARPAMVELSVAVATPLIVVAAVGEARPG
jgi:hypothetical protein